MTTLTEADVEQAALDWLADLGWGVAHGPDIAPDAPGAERGDYGQAAFDQRWPPSFHTSNRKKHQ